MTHINTHTGKIDTTMRHIVGRGWNQMIFNKISKEAERVFRTEKTLKKNLWEEVPDEDLWEDGEISNQKELMAKIEHHLLITGKWTLIRRVSDDS